MTDRELMEIAVEEAERSHPEDGQPRPRVGVVFAKDGDLLARAHRNEDGDGSHAEFLGLKKFEDKNISAEGTSVYTTLEPCIHRRSTKKIPCAKRLSDAKVARVFYGIIDPHRTVQSKGILHLRNHQIPVESFPSDLANRIEACNVEFRQAFTRGEPTTEFINLNHGRRLDEWYQTVNRIYWRQNLGRSPADLFGHLVETIAAISLLETAKKKPGADPRQFVLKAIAWWLAMCGRLRISSVEAMVWAKFPGACPYCLAMPHSDNCRSVGQSPDWQHVQLAGAQRKRPSTLGGWQRMFREIYPATQQDAPGRIFAHLTEELGELAEAIRVFEVVPGLFLNEAPDVFAWILQIQNLLDKDASEPGLALDRAFCAAYPDMCRYCAAEECECPYILPSTVGRLGGAIPPTKFLVDGSEKDAFLSVEKPTELFEL
jgi:pyrimidine deaminase RibD-like protein/NTP pyrophosphatase (non-canonical NTP hydrolase)